MCLIQPSIKSSIHHKTIAKHRPASVKTHLQIITVCWKKRKKRKKKKKENEKKQFKVQSLSLNQQR